MFEKISLLEAIYETMGIVYIYNIFKIVCYFIY